MDTHNFTVAPAPLSAPTPISGEEFIDRIRQLSAGVITKQKISDFLIAYEIRREDLERYINWLPDKHARNKIFRNEEIEAIQDLIAKRLGYKLVDHRLELYAVPLKDSGK